MADKTEGNSGAYGRKMKVLHEAKDRYRRCVSWEATARQRWLDDTKFAEGDSDNLWQWPEDIRQPREDDEKPILTINKVRQCNLDVLNDARQAKVSVKIIPVGDGASIESAEAFMGVVRAIEYRSSAQSAYQHGLRGAVQGGLGYWRVLTQYESNDTFDKEIIIKRVMDPRMVYLDPDITEADGSDANFGFVATPVSEDEFKRRYPKYADVVKNNEFGESSWVQEGQVILAEYYRRVPMPDKLVAFRNPATGRIAVSKLSAIPRRMRKAVMELPDTKSRDIVDYKVEWFTIAGDEIIEETEWEGIYIPLVRVVGEETIIDGQLDRKGHTRHLKDSQRMFNYNASAFIEHGALQSKAPYIAAAEAIEDYEQYWENANRENRSYLPFNGLDEDGNQIAAPRREQPPQGAPLYLEGMKAAEEWMQMASGQYPADFGAPSNERSGVAINARVRQGDMATYHYLDHQSNAIMFTGKILIDLIPKIYDTERVLRYKGEDGNENHIRVAPNHDKAVDTEQTDEETKITIFNPNIGRYSVEADVGKSYQTARQEAFAAYTQILANNKELTSLIGDLALAAADFPGADEAARRLKRMVPPQALDDGENPQLQAAQAQIQQMEQFIQTLAKKLEDKGGDLDVKQEKNSIDAYRAQTDRLTAIKEALGLDASGLMLLVREVLAETAATSASGSALEPALDVPQRYKDMPETMPQAMGGPALDGAPPPPKATA